LSETARAHKEKAPKRLGFAVIICSTSRYRDLKAGKIVVDESGDLIVKTLQTHGNPIFLRDLIPDDKVMIEESVEKAFRLAEVDVVIICGGTGISSTDVTIETVEPLLEKKLLGFGEIFRWLSYGEIGSAAVMTRAIAGVSKGKAVFCIPGSPQAVRLCLEKLILLEAGHIILHARGK
jgi:molybdenum cofactor biosynthesis protein B